ncbi:hypothetical protein [Streptomyces chromofuscus]|uniref:hypothetical protein n=1 Tax=Streptomyces chromofuscus TaxID=42881 RepID=UPI001D15077D|nr:hypothetical protein [Streptomyces chromofuscus]
MTALLVGLAAALTLTACGVPPSDVIQAGEPASGMYSPRPKPSEPGVVFLYFLDDGDPTAYPRKIGDTADLGNVVDQLFGGPTRSEAVTATTELPRLADTPAVTVGGGKDVSIKLPNDVAPFSQPAMLQLACTVAHARGSFVPLPAATHQDAAHTAPPLDAQRSPTHTSVSVLGDGWTMRQSDDSCPDPPQP